MSRNAFKGYIALAILLVAFNVAAFVAPFEKTAVFWIAYGFGTFAILFQLYIYKYPLSDNRSAKSRYYGFSIARLGVYYLVAQLAAGFIEMAFAASFPPLAALIANALLAAMAVVGCLPASAGQDDRDGSALVELQSMAGMMVNLCSDDALKAAMQGIADDLARQAVPDAALEADARSALGDIQQAIVDGDAERAKALCEALAGRLKGDQ